MTFFRILFYGLVGVAALQSLFYYPQLPDVVASHFDGSGSPDGWSGRTTFIAIYLAIVVLVIAIFDGLPRWSGQSGRLRWNLPHRDYWLAPERRAQTLAYFCQQMLIMGCAHLALAIYTIQLVIIANLSAGPRLGDSIFWALGLYFAFLVIWLLRLLLHFRKP